MNIDAKAREIAEQHGLVCLVGPGVTSHEHTLCDCKVIALLAAAMLSVRNEALEEAAKVALAYAQEKTEGWALGTDQDEICHDVSSDISTAIRSMKTTTD